MVMDVADTAATKARYNRLAPIYDKMEYLAELRFKPWREKMWSLVPGGQVLEVGVGTGKNMPYYPDGAQMTAVDLSDKMLAQARRRAAREDVDVALHEMDVQALRFKDDSFDAALATFVFCSVPDPVRGLGELGRVVRPEGRILLLEHVRVGRPAIGRLMDLLNLLVVRVMGANINRRTVENVRRAGLVIERVEDLAPLGLVKLIVARPHIKIALRPRSTPCAGAWPAWRRTAIRACICGTFVPLWRASCPWSVRGEGLTMVGQDSILFYKLVNYIGRNDCEKNYTDCWCSLGAYHYDSDCLWR